MDHKRAVSRAAKIFSRASSPNEHEAAEARRQFDEFSAKYGVSREEVEDYLDAKDSSVEDGGPFGEEDFWRVRIALAVADRAGCRAVKKGERILFEGTPRRARSAAARYQPIVRDVENACGGVYASYGSPDVFSAVLRPILLEEAARAVSERILASPQQRRFPVPREPQEDLLSWSRGRTGSTYCATLHVEWAKRDGYAAGMSISIPE